MRITSGLHRGRTLHSPQGTTTRPTGDRVRESIFNILRHGKFHHGNLLEEATVLDVFAGTGALGLEALSQGAAHAAFIENDSMAHKVCQENITLLKEAARCVLLKTDALKLPPRPPTLEARSLVFLDPPYAKNLGAAALTALAAGNWLQEGAICVLEMAKAAPETLPAGFTLQDERIYGIALVYFMVYSSVVETTNEPIQI